MDAIAVLIVDDHPLYRRGTREALADRPGITVMGEVGSAAEAEAACRVACPTVILLDINLPDVSGIEAAGRLQALCPEAGVIALTAHTDEAYMFAMAEAGARGYLLKSATDAEIESAVRVVAIGGTFFAPAVTQALLRRARGQSAVPDFGLSQRESEVLRYVAAGMTNRQVGRQLGISERTAQAHLSHIFDKLGVSSRTEAVTTALRYGLIELDGGSTEDGA